uniref:NADH-ubiquinone oxidoreductase chain 3 n=1 Tax=Tetraleurodes mori TaxID=267836 RepID=Q6JCQ5_TETMO|nr:NADH dehydrogenase subunit 3 [Tetraleurodes mori]
MLLGLFYSILLILTIFLLSIIGILTNIKLKHSREKYSTFECGFDLLSLLRLPFSLNFYFITIIFLIFDVELTLILPFVFNMKFLFVVQITYLMIFFFFILIAGFMYEWMMGLLNWLI